MHILMGEPKVVILCQSGQENECRPLAETLSATLRHHLGVEAVVVGTNWSEAGSQESMSFYEAIANAKVIVSIFANAVHKTRAQPGNTIWKRIDEYAWYHCLSFEGPSKQRPKYIPICLHGETKEYFAEHLQTIRTGRLPKDWSYRILSTPRADWARSLVEGLKAIVLVLNNGLQLQLTLEDLLKNIYIGSSSDSEKPGTRNPFPNNEKAGPVVTPSEKAKQTAESPETSKEPSSTASFISYDCNHGNSTDDCTVTVTCSEVHNLSIQPDESQQKTIVKINVKL